MNRISDEWLTETLAAMDRNHRNPDVIMNVTQGAVESWLLELRDARERIREMEGALEESRLFVWHQHVYQYGTPGCRPEHHHPRETCDLLKRIDALLPEAS